MSDKIRKYVLPNLPYLLVFWFFSKIGTAYRIAPGTDFGTKLMGMLDTFPKAFETYWPGLGGIDLLVGLAGAAGVYLLIQSKIRQAKKFRRDAEYGTARFGTKEDIKPFVDPKFQNNVILTGTEFLTMNTRPKVPANARNLNACVTRYAGQSSADVFQKKLEAIGIKVYHHYSIDGYPNNVEKIVSDEGYGKNEYVETTRPLVIVTAPGPGSGKMATCLSQLYHENKRGVKAGYAKFETFPIWNIPLKHPVNLAYEAATADLNDVNMIDPFHLEAYGETTVNYNRDIEIYPVLAAMFEGIYGHCPYKSPTDMGVNMAGNCIVDDEACQEASKQEIIRRYYQSVNRFVRDEATKDEVYKQELIMKQAKITVDDRAVVPVANKLAEETGSAAAALELLDGTIVTGSTSDLLGPSSAVLLNAIKILGGIDKKTHLISRTFIEPIQKLKTQYLGSKNPRLHTDEVLIALSMCAVSDPNAKLALQQLPKLAGCQLHTSAILSAVDMNTFKKLGIEFTNEAVYEGRM